MKTRKISKYRKINHTRDFYENCLFVLQIFLHPMNVYDSFSTIEFLIRDLSSSPAFVSVFCPPYSLTSGPIPACQVVMFGMEFSKEYGLREYLNPDLTKYFLIRLPVLLSIFLPFSLSKLPARTGSHLVTAFFVMVSALSKSKNSRF